MSRDTVWTNDDGLRVGFGIHSEDNDVAAAVASANGIVTVTAEYDLLGLSDTFAATNVKPQDHRIPRGSVVKSCIIHTLVTPTGSGATLDLGLWGVDIATEVVDVANGLVAAATVAELDIIGSAILCDGAYIVDSATAVSTQYAVGAVAEADCVLAPSYETAVFTAGKVRVVLEYLPPSGSSGRTLAAVD